jgi:hypothetical protein
MKIVEGTSEKDEKEIKNTSAVTESRRCPEKSLFYRKNSVCAIFMQSGEYLFDMTFMIVCFWP